MALGAVVFFRERLAPLFWLGLALALCGMVVIVGMDALAQPGLGWADMLALVAGFFYAGFFLVAQHARLGLSALSAFWLAAASGAVALWLLTRLLGQPLLGYAPEQYAAMLGLALVTQVGGYLAINYSLGHLPASIVSPTLLGQPVVTALLAVPLLGEAISGWQVAGGTMVLAGIALVHRSRGRPAVGTDGDAVPPPPPPTGSSLPFSRGGS